MASASGFFLIMTVLVIYFLPSLIAAGRRMSSRSSLLVINIFLGWSGLGWVACLAWAFSPKVDKVEDGDLVLTQAQRVR